MNSCLVHVSLPASILSFGDLVKTKIWNMGNMDNDDRLLSTVRSVFGADIGDLSDSSGLNTISGWDSAGHLSLIMAVEAEFQVQFDAAEFGELTTIEAIRQRLARI